MINITDFIISNGYAYATFVSNDLRVSTVCSNEKLIGKGNNEVINILFENAVDIFNKAGVAIDIKYEELDLRLLSETPSVILTQEEMRRINDENTRVLELHEKQKIQYALMQSKDEIQQLKQLLSDLASITLGMTVM